MGFDLGSGAGLTPTKEGHSGQTGAQQHKRRGLRDCAVAGRQDDIVENGADVVSAQVVE